MKQFTQEDELALTIRMALRRVPIPRSKRELDERFSDWPKYVAKLIVDEIKKANWRVEHGPPAQHHTSP